MSKIMTYRNAKCLKCGAIEEVMVMVGAFIMCNKCAEEEFKTDNPPLKERENYKVWLNKYWDYNNKDIEMRLKNV
jgi:hypothetical protein